MTSIERTAYPRFRRLVTAREVVELTPTPDEVAWARDRTRSDSHLLALVVSLSASSASATSRGPTRCPTSSSGSGISGLNLRTPPGDRFIGRPSA